MSCQFNHTRLFPSKIVKNFKHWLTFCSDYVPFIDAKELHLELIVFDYLSSLFSRNLVVIIDNLWFSCHFTFSPDIISIHSYVIKWSNSVFLQLVFFLLLNNVYLFLKFMAHMRVVQQTLNLLVNALMEFRLRRDVDYLLLFSNFELFQSCFFPVLVWEDCLDGYFAAEWWLEFQINVLFLEFSVIVRFNH